MKLKKKIVAVACAVAASAFLTGCNKQIFDFQYTFDTAVITVNGETKVYSISSWTDYQDGEQLQLTLRDGSVILVSSYNTILVCTEGSNGSVFINDLNK